MSYQAYQKVQQDSDNPTETEYRLFAQVTRALQNAEGKKRYDPEFVKALNWNRRMWSTLSTDCSLPGNQLPKQTRAGIISLAIWVSKHSTQVARGQGDIAALISVNKSIMNGLGAQMRQRASAKQPQQTAPQSAPATDAHF